MLLAKFLQKTSILILNGENDTRTLVHGAGIVNPKTINQFVPIKD
jgi:hypothetical protein